MEKDGVWRTICGRKIFIKNGQSLSDAMRESGKFDKEDLQRRLRERLGRDKEELTYDEQYALNKYLGSYSYIINEKLRNSIELTTEDKKFIKDFDNTLDKMPNYKGILKRSYTLDTYDNDMVNQFMKEYEIGKEKVFPSYLSSTTLKEGYNPDAGVQYKIKSKNAKNVIKYNQAEEECIFKRNTKFKIINVEIKRDSWGEKRIFVDMEEI